MPRWEWRVVYHGDGYELAEVLLDDWRILKARRPLSGPSSSAELLRGRYEALHEYAQVAFDRPSLEIDPGLLS